MHDHEDKVYEVNAQEEEERSEFSPMSRNEFNRSSKKGINRMSRDDINRMSYSSSTDTVDDTSRTVDDTSRTKDDTSRTDKDTTDNNDTALDEHHDNESCLKMCEFESYAETTSTVCITDDEDDGKSIPIPIT